MPDDVYARDPRERAARRSCPARSSCADGLAGRGLPGRSRLRGRHVAAGRDGARRLPGLPALCRPRVAARPYGLGTITRSSPGTTSKRTGVRPGSSPSSSTGSGRSGSTEHVGGAQRRRRAGPSPASPGTCGARCARAPALPTSPIRTTSNRPSSGSRVRRDLDAAAELAAVGADDVVGHEVARHAVERDAEGDVAATPRRRPRSPTGTTAVPPSRLEEALARVGDVAASGRTRRRWRTVAHLAVAVRVPGRSRGRRRCARVRPSAMTRRRVRELLRDAVGADEVAARAALDRRPAPPVQPSGWPCSSAKPLTTSLTVPSPPTATTSSSPAAQRLARQRGGVARPPRCAAAAPPGRSRRRSPTRPSGHACRCAPLADAGLSTSTARRAATGLALGLGERGADGELGHAVDGVLQLLVGDADELRSTTTSETLRRQPADMPRRAATVNSTAASISTASTPRSRPALVAGRRRGCRRRRRRRRRSRRAASGRCSWRGARRAWTTSKSAVGACGSPPV